MSYDKEAVNLYIKMSYNIFWSKVGVKKVSCPNEIEDEIYAELEAKLGRGATFEEYRDVAERLPEIVSRRDIKQIVERLAIENARGNAL